MESGKPMETPQQTLLQKAATLAVNTLFKSKSPAKTPQIHPQNPAPVNGGKTVPYSLDANVTKLITSNAVSGTQLVSAYNLDPKAVAAAQKVVNAKQLPLDLNYLKGYANNYDQALQLDRMIASGNQAGAKLLVNQMMNKYGYNVVSKSNKEQFLSTGEAIWFAMEVAKYMNTYNDRDPKLVTYLDNNVTYIKEHMNNQGANQGAVTMGDGPGLKNAVSTENNLDTLTFLTAMSVMFPDRTDIEQLRDKNAQWLITQAYNPATGQFVMGSGGGYGTDTSSWGVLSLDAIKEMDPSFYKETFVDSNGHDRINLDALLSAADKAKVGTYVYTKPDGTKVTLKNLYYFSTDGQSVPSMEFSAQMAAAYAQRARDILASVAGITDKTERAQQIALAAQDQAKGQAIYNDLMLVKDGNGFLPASTQTGWAVDGGWVVPNAAEFSATDWAELAANALKGNVDNPFLIVREPKHVPEKIVPPTDIAPNQVQPYTLDQHVTTWLNGQGSVSSPPPPAPPPLPTTETLAAIHAALPPAGQAVVKNPAQPGTNQSQVFGMSNPEAVAKAQKEIDAKHLDVNLKAMKNVDNNYDQALVLDRLITSGDKAGSKTFITNLLKEYGYNVVPETNQKGEPITTGNAIWFAMEVAKYIATFNDRDPKLLAYLGRNLAFIQEHMNQNGSVSMGPAAPYTVSTENNLDTLTFLSAMSVVSPDRADIRELRDRNAAWLVNDAYNSSQGSFRMGSLPGFATDTSGWGVQALLAIKAMDPTFYNDTFDGKIDLDALLVAADQAKVVDFVYTKPDGQKVTLNNLYYFSTAGPSVPSAEFSAQMAASFFLRAQDIMASDPTKAQIALAQQDWLQGQAILHDLNVIKEPNGTMPASPEAGPAVSGSWDVPGEQISETAATIWYEKAVNAEKNGINPFMILPQYDTKVVFPPAIPSDNAVASAMDHFNPQNPTISTLWDALRSPDANGNTAADAIKDLYGIDLTPQVGNEKNVEFSLINAAHPKGIPVYAGGVTHYIYFPLKTPIPVRATHTYTITFPLKTPIPVRATHTYTITFNLKTPIDVKAAVGKTITFPLNTPIPIYAQQTTSVTGTLDTPIPVYNSEGQIVNYYTQYTNTTQAGTIIGYETQGSLTITPGEVVNEYTKGSLTIKQGQIVNYWTQGSMTIHQGQIIGENTIGRQIVYPWTITGYDTVGTSYYPEAFKGSGLSLAQITQLYNNGLLTKSSTPAEITKEADLILHVDEYVKALRTVQYDPISKTTYTGADLLAKLTGVKIGDSGPISKSVLKSLFSQMYTTSDGKVVYSNAYLHPLEAAQYFSHINDYMNAIETTSVENGRGGEMKLIDRMNRDMAALQGHPLKEGQLTQANMTFISNQFASLIMDQYGNDVTIKTNKDGSPVMQGNYLVTTSGVPFVDNFGHTISFYKEGNNWVSTDGKYRFYGDTGKLIEQTQAYTDPAQAAVGLATMFTTWDKAVETPYTLTPKGPAVINPKTGKPMSVAEKLNLALFELQPPKWVKNKQGKLVNIGTSNPTAALPTSLNGKLSASNLIFFFERIANLNGTFQSPDKFIGDNVAILRMIDDLNAHDGRGMKALAATNTVHFINAQGKLQTATFPINEPLDRPEINLITHQVFYNGAPGVGYTNPLQEIAIIEAYAKMGYHITTDPDPKHINETSSKTTIKGQRLNDTKIIGTETFGQILKQGHININSLPPQIFAQLQGILSATGANPLDTPLDVYETINYFPLIGANGVVEKDKFGHEREVIYRSYTYNLASDPRIIIAQFRQTNSDFVINVKFDADNAPIESYKIQPNGLIFHDTASTGTHGQLPMMSTLQQIMDHFGASSQYPYVAEHLAKDTPGLVYNDQSQFVVIREVPMQQVKNVFGKMVWVQGNDQSAMWRFQIPGDILQRQIGRDSGDTLSIVKWWEQGKVSQIKGGATIPPGVEPGLLLISNNVIVRDTELTAVAQADGGGFEYGVLKDLTTLGVLNEVSGYNTLTGVTSEQSTFLKAPTTQRITYYNNVPLFTSVTLNGQSHIYSTFSVSQYIDSSGNVWQLINEHLAPGVQLSAEQWAQQKKTTILMENGVVVERKLSPWDTSSTKFPTTESFSDQLSNGIFGQIVTWVLAETGLRARPKDMIALLSEKNNPSVQFIPAIEVPKEAPYAIPILPTQNLGASSGTIGAVITVVALIPAIAGAWFLARTKSKSLIKLKGPIGAFLVGVITGILVLGRIVTWAPRVIFRWRPAVTPSEKPVSTVRSNGFDANSKGLEGFISMGFTDTQADAIIRTRMLKGSFTSFADLSKKMGWLDGNKLMSAKDIFATSGVALSRHFFKRRSEIRAMQRALTRAARFQYKYAGAEAFTDADLESLRSAQNEEDFFTALWELYGDIGADKDASRESFMLTMNKYVFTEENGGMRGVLNEIFREGQPALDLVNTVDKSFAARVIMRRLYERMYQSESFKTVLDNRYDDLVKKMGLDKNDVYREHVNLMKDSFITGILNTRELPEGLTLATDDIISDFAIHNAADDLRKVAPARITGDVVSFERLFMYQVLLRRGLGALTGHGRIEDYLWANFIKEDYGHFIGSGWDDRAQVYTGNRALVDQMLSRIEKVTIVFTTMMNMTVQTGAEGVENVRNPQGQVKNFQSYLDQEVLNDALRYALGLKNPVLGDTSRVLPPFAKHEIQPLVDKLKGTFELIMSPSFNAADKNQLAVVIPNLRHKLVGLVQTTEELVKAPYVVKNRLAFWQVFVNPALALIFKGSVRRTVYSSGRETTKADLGRRMITYFIVTTLAGFMMYLFTVALHTNAFLAIPKMIMPGGIMVGLVAAVAVLLVTGVILKHISKSFRAKSSIDAEAISGYRSALQLMGKVRMILIPAVFIASIFLFPAWVVIVPAAVIAGIHFFPWLIFIATWRLGFSAFNYLTGFIATMFDKWRKNVWEISSNNHPKQFVDTLYDLFSDKTPGYFNPNKLRGQERLDSFNFLLKELSNPQRYNFFLAPGTQITEQDFNTNLHGRIEEIIKEITKPIDRPGRKAVPTDYALQHVREWINGEYRTDRPAEPQSLDEILPLTIVDNGYGEASYYTWGDDIWGVKEGDTTHRMGMLARYRTEFFLKMVESVIGKGNPTYDDFLKMIDDPTYVPAAVKDEHALSDDQKNEMARWVSSHIASTWTNVRTMSLVHKDVLNYYLDQFGEESLRQWAKNSVGEQAKNMSNEQLREKFIQSHLRVIEREIVVNQAIDKAIKNNTGSTLRASFDQFVKQGYDRTGIAAFTEENLAKMDAKQRAVLEVMLDEGIWPAFVLGPTEQFHGAKWNQLTTTFFYNLGPMQFNIDADHRASISGSRFIFAMVGHYLTDPRVGSTVPVIEHDMAKGIGPIGPVVPEAEGAFTNESQDDKVLVGGVTAYGKFGVRISAMTSSEGAMDPYVAEDSVTTLSFLLFGYNPERAGYVTIYKNWMTQYPVVRNPIRKWSIDAIESIVGRTPMKAWLSPQTKMPLRVNNLLTDGFGFYLSQPPVKKYIMWIIVAFLIFNLNIFSGAVLVFWLAGVFLGQIISGSLWRYYVFDEGLGIRKGTWKFFRDIFIGPTMGKMYVFYVHVMIMYDETVNRLGSSRLAKFIATKSKGENLNRNKDWRDLYLLNYPTMQWGARWALIMIVAAGFSPFNAFLLYPLVFFVAPVSLIAPFWFNARKHWEGPTTFRENILAPHRFLIALFKANSLESLADYRDNVKMMVVAFFVILYDLIVRVDYRIPFMKAEADRAQQAVANLSTTLFTLNGKTKKDWSPALNELNLYFLSPGHYRSLYLRVPEPIVWQLLQQAEESFNFATDIDDQTALDRFNQALEEALANTSYTETQKADLMQFSKRISDQLAAPGAPAPGRDEVVGWAKELMTLQVQIASKYEYQNYNQIKAHREALEARLKDRDGYAEDGLLDHDKRVAKELVLKMNNVLNSIPAGIDDVGEITQDKMVEILNNRIALRKALHRPVSVDLGMLLRLVKTKDLPRTLKKRIILKTIEETDWNSSQLGWFPHPIDRQPGIGFKILDVMFTNILGLTDIFILLGIYGSILLHFTVDQAYTPPDLSKLDDYPASSQPYRPSPNGNQPAKPATPAGPTAPAAAVPEVASVASPAMTAEQSFSEGEAIAERAFSEMEAAGTLSDDVLAMMSSMLSRILSDAENIAIYRMQLALAEAQAGMKLPKVVMKEKYGTLWHMISTAVGTMETLENPLETEQADILRGYNTDIFTDISAERTVGYRVIRSEVLMGFVTGLLNEARLRQSGEGSSAPAAAEPEAAPAAPPATTVEELPQSAIESEFTAESWATLSPTARWDSSDFATAVRRAFIYGTTVIVEGAHGEQYAGTVYMYGNPDITTQEFIRTRVLALESAMGERKSFPLNSIKKITVLKPGNAIPVEVKTIFEPIVTVESVLAALKETRDEHKRARINTEEVFYLENLGNVIARTSPELLSDQRIWDAVSALLIEIYVHERMAYDIHGPIDAIILGLNWTGRISTEHGQHLGSRPIVGFGDVEQGGLSVSKEQIEEYLQELFPMGFLGNNTRKVPGTSGEPGMFPVTFYSIVQDKSAFKTNFQELMQRLISPAGKGSSESNAATAFQGSAPDVAGALVPQQVPIVPDVEVVTGAQTAESAVPVLGFVPEKAEGLAAAVGATVEGWDTGNAPVVAKKGASGVVPVEEPESPSPALAERADETLVIGGETAVPAASIKSGFLAEFIKNWKLQSAKPAETEVLPEGTLETTESPAATVAAPAQESAMAEHVVSAAVTPPTTKVTVLNETAVKSTTRLTPAQKIDALKKAGLPVNDTTRRWSPRQIDVMAARAEAMRERDGEGAEITAVGLRTVVRGVVKMVSLARFLGFLRGLPIVPAAVSLPKAELSAQQAWLMDNNSELAGKFVMQFAASPTMNDLDEAGALGESGMHPIMFMPKETMQNFVIANSEFKMSVRLVRLPVQATVVRNGKEKNIPVYAGIIEHTVTQTALDGTETDVIIHTPVVTFNDMTASDMASYLSDISGNPLIVDRLAAIAGTATISFDILQMKEGETTPDMNFDTILLGGEHTKNMMIVTRPKKVDEIEDTIDAARELVTTLYEPLPVTKQPRQMTAALIGHAVPIADVAGRVSSYYTHNIQKNNGNLMVLKVEAKSKPAFIKGITDEIATLHTPTEKSGIAGMVGFEVSVKDEKSLTTAESIVEQWKAAQFDMVVVNIDPDMDVTKVDMAKLDSLFNAIARTMPDKTVVLSGSYNKLQTSQVRLLSSAMQVHFSVNFDTFRSLAAQGVRDLSHYMVKVDANNDKELSEASSLHTAFEGFGGVVFDLQSAPVDGDTTKDTLATTLADAVSRIALNLMAGVKATPETMFAQGGAVGAALTAKMSILNDDDMEALRSLNDVLFAAQRASTVDASELFANVINALRELTSRKASSKKYTQANRKYWADARAEVEYLQAAYLQADDAGKQRYLAKLAGIARGILAESVLRKYVPVTEVPKSTWARAMTASILISAVYAKVDIAKLLKRQLPVLSPSAIDKLKLPAGLKEVAGLIKKSGALTPQEILAGLKPLEIYGELPDADDAGKDTQSAAPSIIATIWNMIEPAMRELNIDTQGAVKASIGSAAGNAIDAMLSAA
ncbi:MAG: hypothetical protein ABSH12_00610 [Endomicrobiales bacterium]